jgi:pimeloyl-ACP methyl ester carboxylesterase
VPTTRVNGVDLYYEVHGQGAPILGIHGTPSSALLWVDAARELGTRGKCIIYDRRGFFRSARPRWFTAVDLGDHVEDAAALLDALSATPAVVIGRSTGGEIALELAHRHPGKVKALALLEPAVFTLDPEAAVWADQLRARVLRAAEKAPSSAAETVIREALGDRSWESLPDSIRTMFIEASPAVLAEIRGRGLDLSDDALALSREDLATIGHPTLLVSAEDSPDPLRRVNERLVAALPRADHVHVPGGHFIHPAHPEVLDFLDRVLAPAGHPA